MNNLKQVDIEDLLLEDENNPIESTEISLNDLKAKAEEMVVLHNNVKAAEEALAQAKENLRKIETVELPEMMNSIGIKKLSLDSGAEISIKDDIKASLPSTGSILKAFGEDRDALIERKTMALDWMREHGGDGIIKNEIKVDFGKGQDELAGVLVEFIKGLGVDYDKNTTVHAQSLTSFVKEKIANGSELPFDLFAVYTGLKAVIKQPRKIG